MLEEDELVTRSPIDELDFVCVFLDHYVLWFNVTVEEVLGVRVLQRGESLLDNSHSFLLGESLVFLLDNDIE